MDGDFPLGCGTGRGGARGHAGGHGRSGASRLCTVSPSPATPPPLAALLREASVLNSWLNIARTRQETFQLLACPVSVQPDSALDEGLIGQGVATCRQHKPSTRRDPPLRADPGKRSCSSGMATHTRGTSPEMRYCDCVDQTATSVGDFSPRVSVGLSLSPQERRVAFFGWGGLSGGEGTEPPPAWAGARQPPCPLGQVGWPGCRPGPAARRRVPANRLRCLARRGSVATGHHGSKGTPPPPTHPFPPSRPPDWIHACRLRLGEAACSGRKSCEAAAARQGCLTSSFPPPLPFRMHGGRPLAAPPHEAESGGGRRGGRCAVGCAAFATWTRGGWVGGWG